jgi:5'-deoxynucleotidase YfbR-like HD superfamily hydrolase
VASSEVQLYSGAIIDPLDPDPELFDIRDIAHALSLQCRFSGHVRQHYSVADHSIRVARLVPVEDALEGLMHDASEYLLIDVPSPLKMDLFGEQYRDFEDRICTALAERFSLHYPWPASVHEADKRLLATEVRDLMPRTRTEQERELWEPWIGDVRPLNTMILPRTPAQAEMLFLSSFESYSRRRQG